MSCEDVHQWANHGLNFSELSCATDMTPSFTPQQQHQNTLRNGSGHPWKNKRHTSTLCSLKFDKLSISTSYGPAWNVHCTREWKKQKNKDSGSTGIIYKRLNKMIKPAVWSSDLNWSWAGHWHLMWPLPIFPMIAWRQQHGRFFKNSSIYFDLWSLSVLSIVRHCS